MSRAMVVQFFLAGWLVYAVSTSTCTWNLCIISTQSFGVVSNTPVVRDTTPLWNITHMITEQETTDLHHIAKELYYAYPHSLKLEIICDDELLSTSVSRFYAASGGKPFVYMCTSPDGPETLVPECYIFQAVLVDNSTLSVEDVSCPDTWLCNLAWILPLPVDGQSAMINGKVNSWTSVPVIDSKSFTVSVDGYFSVQDSSSSLTTPPEQSVASLHHLSPSLLLATSNSEFIFSSDEFDSFSLKALLDSDVTTYGSVKCGCLTGLPDVHSVAALSDRFIFLSKVGAIELIGDFTYEGEADTSTTATQPRLVWPHCARRVSLPSHSEVTQQYILVSGACDKQGTAYSAKLQPRNSSALSFTEVLDASGKSACSILEDTTECDILAMGSSGSAQGTWFFLLDVTYTDTSSFFILNSYSDGGMENGEWQQRSVLTKLVPSTASGSRPVMLSLVSSPDSSLSLTGITLAPWVSNHIYLWGNYILHSPDGGSEFYLLTWAFSGSVSLFLTGGSGYVVFYTTDQQLWMSVVGGPTAWILYPSVAWDAALEAQGLSSPFSGSNTLISIFFDARDQLQLVMWDGTQIFRHTVPLELLIAQNNLQTTWGYSSGDVYSGGATSDIRDFQLVERCPFSQILLDVPKNPKYSKLQEFHFRSPRQTGKYLTHSKASFLSYHIMTQNLMSHIRSYNKSYADNYTDSVERWTDALSDQHPYKEYLFQNSHLRHDVHINPWDYNREFTSDEFTAPTLPKTIYLGRFENYTFSILLLAKEDDGSGAFDQLQRLMISAQVSNSSLVTVSITSETFYINDTVKYKVQIRDLGTHAVQSAPGVNLYPTSVELSILNAPSKCFEVIGDKLQHQGGYHTTVMLGCPPSQRLVFDWQTSFDRMQESDIQEFPWDCVSDNLERPCFYYSNGFYPYFVVLDDASGHSELFTGKYMLRVIGGGHIDADNIRMFSSDEVRLYNNINLDGTPSLVFGPMGTVEDVDGWPVYNHTTNMISWFCQPGSPCTNIYPVFPKAPEYYFLLEFTNRDLTRNLTNCDYTMRFLVHVHGLPIDPLRTSLLFVTISIFVICLYVLVYYLCHRRNGKVISFITNTMHQMLLRVLQFLGRKVEDDEHVDVQGPTGQGEGEKGDIGWTMTSESPEFVSMSPGIIMEEEDEETPEYGHSPLPNINNSASPELVAQPCQLGRTIDDILNAKSDVVRLRKPPRPPTRRRSTDMTDEEYLDYLPTKTAWGEGSTPSQTDPLTTRSPQPSFPHQSHGVAIGILTPQHTQTQEPPLYSSLKTPAKYADKFVKKSLATPNIAMTKRQMTPTDGSPTTPSHRKPQITGCDTNTAERQKTAQGMKNPDVDHIYPETVVSEEHVNIEITNTEEPNSSPGSTGSLNNSNTVSDNLQKTTDNSEISKESKGGHNSNSSLSQFKDL